MDYLAIQAALENQLDAWATANTVTVLKENSDIKPAVGTTYVAPAFLPIQPSPAALGELAANRCEGIFQVTVSAPRGEGRGPALALASSIANYFKRGTQLTANGTKVTVTSSGPLPARPTDTAYNVPTDIHWTTDQPN